MFFAAALLTVSSSALPPAPQPVPAPIRKAHNFNGYDLGLYLGVLGYHSMDYVTTEHNIHAPGGYENVLPVALVKSHAGFAAYCGVLAAAEIGGSYWLHKHGHAKLARVADTISVAAGFTTVARNKVNAYQ
jgi:hypothetical protein